MWCVCVCDVCACDIRRLIITNGYLKFQCSEIIALKFLY